MDPIPGILAHIPCTYLLMKFQQRAEFNINGYRVREINTIG